MSCHHSYQEIFLGGGGGSALVFFNNSYVSIPLFGSGLSGFVISFLQHGH